jgi:hypothetical protein
MCWYFIKLPWYLRRWNRIYLSTHKNTQYTSCTIPPRTFKYPFCLYFSSFAFIFSFSFLVPFLSHSPHSSIPNFPYRGHLIKPPLIIYLTFTLVRYSTAPVHEYLFFVLHYPELGRTAGRRDRTRLLQSRRGGRTGRVGTKGKLDEGAGQRWRQRRQ